MAGLVPFLHASGSLCGHGHYEEQGQGPGSSHSLLAALGLQAYVTSHIVNLIGGITCSFGRGFLSNLVSNQVPLQLLQIGQYTSALQTHGQKTKIHHLPATLKAVCDVDVFAQE